MDFNKAFEAAKPSIIGLVILGFIKMGITNLMKGSVIAEFSGWPSDVIFFMLVLFAGYRATKILNYDLATAALAGALAAFVQAVVWAILMIVGVVFVIQSGQVPIPEELSSILGTGGSLAAVVVTLVVFMAVIGIVSMVMNAIVGAIGGFVGQKLK